MVVAKRTRNSTDNCQKSRSLGCGIGTLDDCIKCAILWNRMSSKEKDKYRQTDSSMEVCEQDEPMDVESPEASCTQRPNPTCCPSRQRKKRCGVKRRKWVKPGPITTNPYLNYVRTVRRKYCGLLPKQLVMLAAYDWNHLSDNRKLRYRLQAYNEKARKRRICRMAAMKC